MRLERFKLRHQHPLGGNRARREVVIAVGHDLGLDDRNQPVPLTDDRVLRQVVDTQRDREIRRQALIRVDLKYVAPLGEACALRVSRANRSVRLCVRLSCRATNYSRHMSVGSRCRRPSLCLSSLSDARPSLSMSMSMSMHMDTGTAQCACPSA